jgi:hypothetical protein
MQIMGLLRADKESEAGAPPDMDLMMRMGAFVEEMTKAGVLLNTNGLHPSAKGKRIKLADGKVTIIDGPFTESKELVASYAIFQVQSMDEAVMWSKRFLECLVKGEVELRPIFDPADFRPRCSPRSRPRMKTNCAARCRVMPVGASSPAFAIRLLHMRGRLAAAFVTWCIGRRDRGRYPSRNSRRLADRAGETDRRAHAYDARCRPFRRICAGRAGGRSGKLAG